MDEVEEDGVDASTEEELSVEGVGVPDVESKVVPVRLPKKDLRAFEGAAAAAAAKPVADFAANVRTLEGRMEPLWPLPRPRVSLPLADPLLLTLVPLSALPSFRMASRKA